MPVMLIFYIVLFLVLTVLIAWLLTGCGQTAGGSESTEETKPGGPFREIDMTDAEISPDALAAHLLGTVSFADTLVPMEPEIAARLYDVQEQTESIAGYGSTGATAEAILVIACPDADAAKEAAARVEKYRTEMAQIYADYNPTEAQKLRAAFLEQNGRYVVYCAAPDPGAAKDAYLAFFKGE